MFGRQSDTAQAAETLRDHAAAVASDSRLPDHIRLAAACVADQAADEAREYQR